MKSWLKSFWGAATDSLPHPHTVPNPYIVIREVPRENPPPTPNTSLPIWEMVVMDMIARDKAGRKKYGTPLQANNGRDALLDAYEEALDLAVYLKQAIVERDERRVALKKAIDRGNRAKITDSGDEEHDALCEILNFLERM